MVDDVESDFKACTIQDDVESDKINRICLTNFPVEIFTKICSFLDLDFVNTTLSLVCQRFHDILTDEQLWRSWLNKRVGGKKYPPLDIDSDNYDWRRECAYVDSFNLKWSNVSNKISIVAKEAHSAAVDTLLLKNNGALAISGSRDRCIAIWNIKKVIEENKVAESIENNVNEICIDDITPSKWIDAHEGWIWDLATPSTNANFFLSCSWDSKVKIWDIQTLYNNHQFRCPTTVLCVTCVDENISVAGLFSPQVILLDKRVGNNVIETYNVHKRSVLNATVSAPGSTIIYTCSEDRHIAALDIRVGKVINKSLLDQSDTSVYGLKVCANSNVCPGVLFVGDPSGAVHMLDKKDLSVITTTRLWPLNNKKSKVTGLSMEPGALVACSSNGSIKMMNPSNPINEINDISSVSNEYTALHFQNNVLIASDNSYSIRMWIPHSSNLIG